MIPYNPIAGGLLSGKHTPGGSPAEGTRFTLGTAGQMYQSRYWHEREFDTVAQLQPLADEAGVSLVTLSVAWVLANDAVTAPIIGASRPDQLDASLAAVDFRPRRRPGGSPRRAHPRLPHGRRTPLTRSTSKRLSQSLGDRLNHSRPRGELPFRLAVSVPSW